MAEEKYDIVIIGGGIAGSMLAYKISSLKPHLKIVILEAGSDRSAERTDMSLAFAGSVIKSPISAYDKNPDILLKSPGATHDYFDSTDEFKSTYLKIGGGTTWHWLGNVPRHLPNDFKLKTKYGHGVDWPIEYSDLEKFYCEAEHEMGVSGDGHEWTDLAPRSKDFPMPRIWPSYLELQIRKELQGKVIENAEINIRGTPQARNSQAYEGRPACAGNSSCVPVCPIQAKYDATVHINKALKNGVTIKYKASVREIKKDDRGQIIEARYRNWIGEEGSVKGKIFVLAAHAIESSILLLFNNLAAQSGLVGKNLMDHPQGYGVGIYKDPLYTFRGPPTTSGIDVFRDGDFRSDTAAFRISVGNDGWGRFVRKDNTKNLDNLEFLIEEKFGTKDFVIGKQFREAVEQKITRIFRFSYSTEMLPDESNKVELSAIIDPISKLPRPKISFKIDRTGQYNNNGFKKAQRVLTGLFTSLNIPATDFEVQGDNAAFSGAGHIMGTTRMGNDPKTSVVDKHCKSHEHDNLYMLSSGVFPTSCTANPTLTVAALSLRLAEEINRKFK